MATAEVALVVWIILLALIILLAQILSEASNKVNQAPPSQVTFWSSSKRIHAKGNPVVNFARPIFLCQSTIIVILIV